MHKIVKKSQVNDEKKYRVIDYGYSENVDKQNTVINKKNSIANSDEVKAAKKIAEKTISMAEKKAQEIIDNAVNNAKEKANSIIKDAQIKSDVMAKKVFDDEQKQGYENGFKQSRKEIFDLRQFIMEHLEKISSNQKIVNDDMNNNVLDLSFIVASKILHREIEKDGEVVEKMLTTALEQVRKKSNINIIISQKIVDDVDELKTKLNEKDLFNRYIDFSVNDETEDEIVIDAEDTVIDMSLDTQLLNIKKLFTLGDD